MAAYMGSQTAGVAPTVVQPQVSPYYLRDHAGDVLLIPRIEHAAQRSGRRYGGSGGDYRDAPNGYVARMGTCAHLSPLASLHS